MHIYIKIHLCLEKEFCCHWVITSLLLTYIQTSRGGGTILLCAWVTPLLHNALHFIHMTWVLLFCEYQYVQFCITGSELRRTARFLSTPLLRLPCSCSVVRESYSWVIGFRPLSLSLSPLCLPAVILFLSGTTKLSWCIPLILQDQSFTFSLQVAGKGVYIRDSSEAWNQTSLPASVSAQVICCFLISAT